MTPPAAEADDEEEGEARCAAPPRPSSGLRHVPIPIGHRHVVTLVFVFQQGGQIRAASASSDRIRREVMCADGAYRRILAGAASSLT